MRWFRKRSDTAQADPGECSLCHPSALEHVEAAQDVRRLLARSGPHAMQPGPPMLADRQRPAQPLSEPGFPALVGAVGPNQGNTGELCLEASGQQFGAAAVVDVVDVGRVRAP